MDKAIASDSYIKNRHEILNKFNLKCYEISAHLVGQCVADDPIDERHRSVLPDRLWGDGYPDGVRSRAQQELKDTAVAAKMMGVKVINGFTGSPVWKNLYFFLPLTRG